MFFKYIPTFLANQLTFYACRRLCSCVNTFTCRTHTCGELNSSHVGQEVLLCGWTTFQRCDRFIILRDSYGYTQVIFKDNDQLSKKFITSLPLESVIQVKGTVLKRPPKNVNKRLPTGQIEVEAIKVQLLNPSIPKLPIGAKDQDKVTDTIKLKYRYLSLRNLKLQENLRLRSKVLMKMRDFLLNKHGFVDVETPTLFRKTPGGAKEFIVPTKFPGNVYSLTQSPQQFKQMLMVGGIDRYFQIARCYRNEGTKADRQPEFTQVDIELSFSTVKDIQRLVELLLKYSWPTEKSDIRIPFPILTYENAICMYGTDKPDLRYELKLLHLTDDFLNSGLKLIDEGKNDPEFNVSSIIIPNGSKLIKNSLIKDFQKEAELQSVKFFHISVKDDMSWISAVAKHVNDDTQKRINQKFHVQPGDLILSAVGIYKSVKTFLGKARTRCAEHLQLVNVDLLRSDEYSFVWITDFPLFLEDENGALESAHHPFTAPHSSDIDLIYTDPLKAKGQHYDLVLNGQEVGGGSIRIHDASLQKYILEDVLKEESRDLKHLLDALSSGCPPHGGIALGIDRILAIMCGCHSIADVIAFPKSLDGKDLMSGAPSPISEEDKLLYHIESIMPK